MQTGAHHRGGDGFQGVPGDRDGDAEDVGETQGRNVGTRAGTSEVT